MVKGIAAVCATERHYVGDRVIGGAYLAHPVVQPGEPLVNHGPYQVIHSAEVGVDRHRGRADGRGKATGGKCRGSFLREEPGRRLYQGDRYLRVSASWTHG